jgi:hypothetical protein
MCKKAGSPDLELDHVTNVHMVATTAKRPPASLPTFRHSVIRNEYLYLKKKKKKGGRQTNSCEEKNRKAGKEHDVKFVTVVLINGKHDSEFLKWSPARFGGLVHTGFTVTSRYLERRQSYCGNPCSGRGNGNNYSVGLLRKG